MPTTEHILTFRQLFTNATAAVVQEYFMLPIAGGRESGSLTQYRERVYAYELYHQLRLRWPAWAYSMAGEADKSGHPLIHGGNLDNAKPDLIVHCPGHMEDNLAVIEIKAAGGDSRRPRHDDIQADLRKLTAFRSSAHYALAILLVFGPSIHVIQRCIRQRDVQGADLTMIELWHHGASGEPARMVEWGNTAT